VPVCITDEVERGNALYARMKTLGKIEHLPRRECYRLSLSTSVLLKRAAEGEVRKAEARTVDFSDGGMLLATDEELNVNEVVTLDFHIGGHEIVDAKVLRLTASETRRPRFSAAMKFIEPGNDQKKRFYKYITEQKMRQYERQDTAQDQGGQA
jgi:c-di-GMP-binding flagellar brake protein YcgR